MRFAKWLLSEIQRHSFLPLNINGVLADVIDFRFEDWRKGVNPAKSKDLVRPMDGREFFVGSFVAPLDNGKWLTVSEVSEEGPEGSRPMTYRQFKAFRAQGLGTAAWAKNRVDVEILDQAPEGHRHLTNPDWFRYAALYLQNRLVKEPEWPRDDHEVLSPERQTLPVRQEPDILQLRR